MANSWLDSLRKAAAGTFKTPRDLPDEAIAISCPTSLELQGSNNRTSLGCVEAQQQHQPGMASRPSARNAVMRRNPTRGESGMGKIPQFPKHTAPRLIEPGAPCDLPKRVPNV